jgi:hypothetical protein
MTSIITTGFLTNDEGERADRLDPLFKKLRSVKGHNSLMGGLKKKIEEDRRVRSQHSTG